MKSGFTLLELLAVVGILSFILIATTQLLSSTLAGSGKSNSLQLVKQNGQFALSTMERTVRRAKTLTTCSGGTLTVTVPETTGDVIYTFKLNGTTLERNDIKLTDADVRVTDFSCSLTPAAVGNPAVVDLSLTIDKLGLSVENSVVNTTFNTSVSLRTY